MTARMVVRVGMPDTAEGWITRLRADDVTPEERVAFEAWLDADERNMADYIECRDLETITSDLRRHPERIGKIAARLEQLRGSRTKPRRQWFVPAALAASIALVAILVALPRSGDNIRSESAATRHGEQRVIALADGSSVVLNTGSEIEWSIAAGERRVDLKHGEAFFSVSKDSARPFVVRAGNSEVRVVGTQFSVRLDGEKMDVVVREGIVKVIPDAGILTFMRPKVELTGGSRLKMLDTGVEVKVAAVDADRVTAWRTGSLEFDGLSLEEVVLEVNRYADTPLVIEDQSLKQQPISGIVRVGDIKAVRFILRERFGIASVDRDGAIRLSRE